MSKLFYNSEKTVTPLFNNWSFSKINYLLFFAGILFIIIGYIIMSFGETYSFQSLSIAPVMLFMGYIILIPASLIYRRR
tara:strand:- start:68 stop:304 length:237 start_codon:yes stop_codon:yes gene_type:complete